MKNVKYKECKIWAKTSFTVDRELTISEASVKIDYKGEQKEQPKYKYKEEITFREHDTGEKAVCLGYNPALAIDEIDTTNKRLITCLEEKGFSGYILLNLYPEVTPYKGLVNMEDTKNRNHINYIRKELENLKNCIVIMFFGRTTFLNEDAVNLIKEISDSNEVKITCFKEEFIHPSSVGSFELMDFKKEYIRTNTCQQIRVNER